MQVSTLARLPAMPPSAGRSSHQYFCDDYASSLASLRSSSGLALQTQLSFSLGSSFAYSLDPLGAAPCRWTERNLQSEPLCSPFSPDYQAVRGDWTGPDEINVGCWLVQFGRAPPCHRCRLVQDWDICKLSSFINICLEWHSLPPALLFEMHLAGSSPEKFHCLWCVISKGMCPPPTAYVFSPPPPFPPALDLRPFLPPPTFGKGPSHSSKRPKTADVSDVWWGELQKYFYSACHSDRELQSKVCQSFSD